MRDGAGASSISLLKFCEDSNSIGCVRRLQKSPFAIDLVAEDQRISEDTFFSQVFEVLFS